MFDCLIRPGRFSRTLFPVKEREDDQVQRPNTEAPMYVAYGAGVDSTAMLVLLMQRGIRPDKIIFSDTGGEKPETYQYLNVMHRWLIARGFPPILTVRYQLGKTYHTLEDKCHVNETLPSLAYPPIGGRLNTSCSSVFKAETIQRHIKGIYNRRRNLPKRERYTGGWDAAWNAWLQGLKVTCAIGYDAGHYYRTKAGKKVLTGDAKRGFMAKEDPEYEYWYPLREAGWTREICKEEIHAAGLPVPIKSACFFCPASKPAEVLWLADNHPDLFERAVAIEDQARGGKHGLRSKDVHGLGLGWSESWEDYVESHQRSCDDDHSAHPDLYEV